MTEIGKVLRPRGIRGEIKVLPLILDLSFFSTLKSFFIDGREYHVTDIRIDAASVYIKTKEIADMNAAELLRNKVIFVKDSDFPKLPEGRYYVKDLLGLSVNTSGGEFLGNIANIDSFGAADVITIIKDGKEILFPYLNAVVKKVDLQAKIMTVDKNEFLKVCVDED